MLPLEFPNELPKFVIEIILQSNWTYRHIAKSCKRGLNGSVVHKATAKRIGCSSYLGTFHLLPQKRSIPTINIERPAVLNVNIPWCTLVVMYMNGWLTVGKVVEVFYSITVWQRVQTQNGSSWFICKEMAQPPLSFC